MAMNVIVPTYPVQVRVKAPGQLHVRALRESLFDDDFPISYCAQCPHAQCDKIIMREKATISALWDVDFQPGLDYRRANFDEWWEFALHFSP
jgi:hypothetical protein